MRANEQNRIASFSTSQLFSLNFKHSIEKENYTVMEEHSSEYGLSLADIKGFKKRMGRS
ncbi:hypothetical protein [Lederbergia panacisoli]|uniref:hypothetical protein n=1 Tax=Lederbergia panacisoli TaxID=1255251 RepID=UPI00214CDA46|nr:hypothetical protein [Lederbergia panacisoli]MCR2820503.1 hypothetical protein [Lederbergia panacisoli]